MTLIKPVLICAGLCVAIACSANIGTELSAEETQPKETKVVYSCERLDEIDLKGVSAAELDPAQLPERTRILGPNSLATMDYLPDRLNLRTDAQGVIQGWNCG